MIDILVGIKSMRSRAKFIKPIEALGYKWRKDVARPNKQLWFLRGPENKITHRLQLKKYKDASWNAGILFRDYLRKNKKRARQYAQLKRSLADKYANNIGRYMEGKARFINETIQIAEAVGPQHRIGKEGARKLRRKGRDRHSTEQDLKD